MHMLDVHACRKACHTCHTRVLSPAEGCGLKMYSKQPPGKGAIIYFNSFSMEVQKAINTI